MTEERIIRNQATKILSQVPHAGLNSPGLHSTPRLTLSTAAEEKSPALTCSSHETSLTGRNLQFNSRQSVDDIYSHISTLKMLRFFILVIKWAMLIWLIFPVIVYKVALSEVKFKLYYQVQKIRHSLLPYYCHETQKFRFIHTRTAIASDVGEEYVTTY